MSLIRILLILISTSSLADEVIIAEDFFYNGAPVEPYCLVFPNDKTMFNSVSLAECSNINGKIKIIEDDRLGNDKGFIGYSYKDQQNKHSYIYYKYLGKINDVTYLWTLSNHGNDLNIDQAYSEVILIKKTNDAISLVMEPTGGAGCNGGIDRASVKLGKFSYDQKITPFDFITLSGDYQYHLRADEDLASCSICCAGIANYEDVKLKAIRLTASEFMISGKVYGKYQACFNGLFNDALVKRGSLDIKGLKSFINKFGVECVKK